MVLSQVRSRASAKRVSAVQLVSAAVLTASPLAAALAAQPTAFVNVGRVTVPAIPSGASTSFPLPTGAFDYGIIGVRPGETLTVKWFRFELQGGATGAQYLDLDTSVIPSGDVFLALYDGQGVLVATDDADGSLPNGFAAALSFGSTQARTGGSANLVGQDGPLEPGLYWLALVAGSADEVVALPTNWNVTTTASLPLGLIEPGTSFVSLSITAGNTGPCDGPVVTPTAAVVEACAGGTAQVEAAVTSTEVASLQWEALLPTTPAGPLWVPLSDGPASAGALGAFGSSTAEFAGTDTTTLTITGVDEGAALQYRLVATTCGSTRSDAVQVTIATDGCDGVCPVCPADFDQDGGVTGADIEAFFLAFESGESCGDTDLDGGVTGADIEAFFVAFEAGGC
jgi:hypothetical protein